MGPSTLFIYKGYARPHPRILFFCCFDQLQCGSSFFSVSHLHLQFLDAWWVEEEDVMGVEIAMMSRMLRSL